MNAMWLFSEGFPQKFQETSRRLLEMPCIKCRAKIRPTKYYLHRETIMKLKRYLKIPYGLRQHSSKTKIQIVHFHYNTIRKLESHSK